MSLRLTSGLLGGYLHGRDFAVPSSSVHYLMRRFPFAGSKADVNDKVLSVRVEGSIYWRNICSGAFDGWLWVTAKEVFGTM